MPQPVELRVRGGERRRVPVAETDDRDACEEVEVALAVGVDEPRALAVGERDVESRVGREELRERCDVASCDHRRAADLRRDAAARRERGGAQLRHDAALELAGVEHARRAADVDRVEHLVVDVQARPRR